MSIERYFKGKHVVVTGGSSGIGLATAERLCGVGATVTIVARRADVLEAARARLGPNAQALALDIANEAAVHETLGAHAAAHPVDMLINNAGVVMPGRFLDLPTEQFRWMMDINYFGTVYCCKALIPSMQARGGGHILNVSSMAGCIGIYGYTAYSATKFALCGFSQCLRAEMWPHHIQVSVCLPPDTDTPQLAFENQYKPAETKAIAGNVKTLPAAAVAEAMLVGMAKGSFEIIPGFDGWSSALAQRLVPGVVRMVCDSAQKKAATLRP
ncbi:MAG: SDR family NAD(P)-dependent oxidoreductase [Myxococcales bacterium]|nr:SDR family NAD(P)-dependent oxidoreductase [Myxococcales bacterium]